MMKIIIFIAMMISVVLTRQMQQSCQATDKNRYSSGIFKKSTKPNQDTLDFKSVSLPNGIQLQYAAVFDGHGKQGQAASQLSKDLLFRKLSDSLSTNDVVQAYQYGDMNYVAQQIQHAVVLTDHQICTQHYFQVTDSGSTAAIAVLIGDNLFLGHLGDAIYVLGDRSGRIYADNFDKFHHYGYGQEHIRIHSAKGQIDHEDGSIFHQGSINGNLRYGVGNTRAFADCELKVHFDENNYSRLKVPGLYRSYDGILSVDAEIHHMKITSRDTLNLVLASDGIMDGSFPTMSSAKDFAKELVSKTPKMPDFCKNVLKQVRKVNENKDDVTVQLLVI